MTWIALLFSFTGWTLFVARLTKLTTSDMITDFLRIAVYNRWGEHSLPAYLAVCSWCQSIWYAGITAWIVILASGIGWWWYPVLVGAGSYLVGLIATNLEPEDDAEVIATK